MSGYGGIEQGSGVNTPGSRPRTSDQTSDSVITPSAPHTLVDNGIPQSNPAYNNFSSRVSYPAAGPSAFQNASTPQGGRMIGSTGSVAFAGMGFGNFGVPSGGYYPAPTGNGVGTMAMAANMPVDPLTGLPAEPFVYDAASALPPISQNFARPNIDDSRRPATSAGIMLRTFAGGYGGYGFGVNTPLGTVTEGSVASGSNGRMMNPAFAQHQQPQQPVVWQPLPTSSLGEFTGHNGIPMSANDDDDDLKNVFSHTVDVNGVSILGGPTFQDPFAVEAAAQGHVAGSGPGDSGQVPPDRQMTGGSGVSIRMHQIDLAENDPQTAAYNNIPMNQSTCEASSAAWSNQNVLRRSSEPHFKANQHNVSLPSHASLYQTLGLGQMVPGQTGEGMTSGQQQAMTVAALAARRGSSDLGNFNTNQLRHLIAQRKGSAEYSRQPQTASKTTSSTALRRTSDVPNGGISPAQISWRGSLPNSQQRRPVSQGNMSYVDPRMASIPRVDDAWQDRYAPVPYKTMDPSSAHGRPASGGHPRMSGGDAQITNPLNGFQGGSRYPAGEPNGSRQPDVRVPPSVFVAHPPVPAPVRTSYTDPDRSRPSTADRRASAGTSASQPGSNAGAYSFQSHVGPAPKKRPRRKFDQIERLYLCGFEGCEKSYGTLNHLNAHVSMQKHGIKRRPEEFKDIRKEWRKKKKEEAARARAESGGNPNQGSSNQVGGNNGLHSSHDEDSYDEDEHWRDDGDAKRAHDVYGGYPVVHAGPRVGVGYEQAPASWNGMHDGVAAVGQGYGAEYDGYIRR